MSFLDIILGKKVVHLSDQNLERLAELLSKHRLEFNDKGIKRIARQIVEDDKEEQRLCKQIVLDSDTIDRLAKRVLTSPKCYLLFLFLIGVLWGIAYFTILKSTTNQVKEQVSTAAKTEVAKQFENDSIKKLVNDAAKDRVELVADPLIISNIGARITPLRTELLTSLTEQQTKIAEINSTLQNSQQTESNLQDTVKEAKDVLKQLNQDSEFVIKAILAENDDRSAYEQLVKWSKEDGYRNQKPAQDVSSAIRASYYDVSTRAWEVINWDAVRDSTNRYSWKMPYIMGAWKTLNQHELARDYLNFVLGQTNITKEQRLSFLRNVCIDDSRNSILAAHTAAKTISPELGAAYSMPLEYSNIEKRWQEYSTTNHLFEIPANNPTNVFYDLIPASATNRVHLLRDWGKTKFLLFELAHTPVQGSLEAKFIDYKTCVEDSLLPTYTNYFNTIAVYIDGMHSDSIIKCECKYSIDYSKTNVSSIAVTTNAVIFNGSLSIPIPH